MTGGSHVLVSGWWDLENEKQQNFESSYFTFKFS
jgi:hypothetical protein